MRGLGLAFSTVLFAAVAGPASACLEIVTEESRARSFETADAVVTVVAQTETYLPVPNTKSLRAGVGSGRVIESLKGYSKPGMVISYRVVDGESSDASCPARRSVRPGGMYKLYLKQASDGGPPIILLPTD